MAAHTKLGRMRGTGRGLMTGTALCTAFFMAFSALPANAQSYSFSSIKVEGNTLVDPATIVKFAAIPKGQPISAGQARRHDAV